MTAFVAGGGEPAGSSGAVARSCPVLVLSLPDSDVVEAVIHEIESELPGKTVIDTTTGDPDRTALLGQRLREIGAHYLDATVIGSSRQVRAGAVTVVVGGEPEPVQHCTPLLRTFAAALFHVGPWGSGARMKLVVNLVLGLNRAVLAEGLTFARAVGVEPGLALAVLQAGAAYSRVMDTKGDKMVKADFSVEARLRQHHKDVSLILAAAARRRVNLPLSRVHEQLLGLAEDRGYADLDNSAIIRAFDDPV